MFEPADVIYVNAGATRPADAWLDRLKALIDLFDDAVGIAGSRRRVWVERNGYAIGSGGVA